MKKKPFDGFVLRKNGLWKTFLIMKLTTFFLFCFVFGGFASTLAQYRVNVRLGETTYKQLFEEIRKQTGCIVMYNDQMLNKRERVNVDFENASLEEVLTGVLGAKGLTFEQDKEFIIIVKAPEQTRTAQQKSVKLTGTVVGKDKMPLPGVSVFVKGTTLGVATDVDGNFSLTLPGLKDVTLVFSFVGMTSKEVVVTDDKPLHVVLEEDAQEMDEVVVNGIFTRKANSFTGSVVTMTKDKLLQVGNQNVFQSLKNLDPSLMIFDNMEFGSDPNRMPKMQLRGTSSFDLGGDGIDLKGTYGSDPNAPLFILDGFEATVEKIMDLDMNRIESLTILKDASAKAVYGSKAANGVVVIETKKTTDGDLRVTYTGSVDVSLPDLSSYDLANAMEKLQIEKDAGLYEPEEYDPVQTVELNQKYNRILTSILSGVNTDWLAKPLHTGVGNKHTLSVELGSNDLRVIADLSYNKVRGVMKGSDRTTTAGSLMVSYRHKKLNFRNILTVTANESNDSPYGTFDEYARLNPYYSPYDQNGILVQNMLLHFNSEENVGSDFIANPLYNASLNTLLQQQYIDVTNNSYIEWTIVNGLKATGRLGITEKRTKADEFYPANHLKFRGYSEEDFFRRGSYQINEGDSKTLSADLNINGSKQLGEKHFLFGNIGYHVSETSYQEDIYNAEGFPNDKMNNIIFARQFTKDSKPTGTESTTRELGFLTAVNYTYDNRFLFDGSWRASASSMFGKNKRWGQFWSLGAGWNIHYENWMKQFENLSLLKLRASMGYTGSQSSEAYAALASYNYFLDKVYDQFMGASLKGMKNDDLQWQEKLDYNIGLDVDFNHNFTLKFDYYIALTTNTLLSFTLPASTGFTSVMENVGNVRNSGFDLYLTYTPWRRTADRSYFMLTGSISHNKNKITGISEAMKDYNARQDELFADRFEEKSSRPVQKYYEGVSMNAIWAVRSLGIDPATGREIFLDRNGNRTNLWNAGDQVICGDDLPDFQGNIGANFSWKGLSLNVVFRYQWGGQMYNTTLLNAVENAELAYNVDRRVLSGRWRNPGDVKPYKAIRYAGYGEDRKMERTQPTSRFVQDRNDLTLSSVNLSYDMFRHNIKKWGMETLRFSFYMNDVYTWSSIKVERGTSYPFARTMNFSLSATF